MTTWDAKNKKAQMAATRKVKYGQFFVSDIVTTIRPAQMPDLLGYPYSGHGNCDVNPVSLLLFLIIGRLPAISFTDNYVMRIACKQPLTSNRWCRLSELSSFNFITASAWPFSWRATGTRKSKPASLALPAILICCNDFLLNLSMVFTGTVLLLLIVAVSLADYLLIRF